MSMNIIEFYHEGKMVIGITNRYDILKWRIDCLAVRTRKVELGIDRQRKRMNVSSL
ncbi:hypothetical protein GFC29_642 [Anoxybacillus sp. B7M1]|uniref:hypothetical protein n=1 Tax=unclassified Anoxybacillus TaxID=2639704 RepID=UPI0007B5AB77|nr:MULTISPECIES: hypothetical protein [unclassified Anoxybacillus]ANB57821.1 hypothetical protein GFC28_985 [Anoxybacillus sp. B2M1]ANB62467.1 hypothetical protein GFC29_642 [Anoxybacillus sp. B7M1]